MAAGQLWIGAEPATDGPQISMRGGASGEAIVQALHGKYYEQARRGNVFHSYVSSAAAGFPAFPTNALVKSALWNGSASVVCSLIAFSVFLTAVTTSQLSLGLTGGNGQYATPTALTNPTKIFSAMVGSNVLPQATPYLQATFLVGPGTAGQTNPWYVPIILGGSVSPFPAQFCTWDVAGTIVVPPFGWIGMESSALSTVNFITCMTWEEIPI